MIGCLTRCWDSAFWQLDFCWINLILFIELLESPKKMRIVCWVDDEMQKKVSNEFTNSEIILVQSFIDFTKNVTDDSLNLISASNFDDFDISGFIYKVAEFFRSKPNQKISCFSVHG